MSIMCAQKLWRVVRRWDMSVATTARDTGGLLGPWAATRFEENDDDLVIAINQSTYLTVVFPLSQPEATCDAFRDAVAAALTDLRVPAVRIESELTALEPVHFEWLRDGTLRSVLRDLETFCGIELAYHSDLRIVQRNLNAVPHGSLAVHVPSVAVAMRLGRTETSGSGPH